MEIFLFPLLLNSIKNTSSIFNEGSTNGSLTCLETSLANLIQASQLCSFLIHNFRALLTSDEICITHPPVWQNYTSSRSLSSTPKFVTNLINGAAPTYADTLKLTETPKRNANRKSKTTDPYPQILISWRYSLWQWCKKIIVFVPWILHTLQEAPWAFVSQWKLIR